ncbi:Polymer-forming protein [Micrococcales bacterium KH10]|nr:Polymer-forming protein [Micrococcales bacterium KH10]
MIALPESLNFVRTVFGRPFGRQDDAGRKNWSVAFRERSRPPAYTAVMAGVAIVGVVIPTSFASAAELPVAEADSAALSIVSNPSTLVAARYAELPPYGNPVTVSSSPLSSFPQNGGSYLVMSTGDSTRVAGGDSATHLSVNNGGGSLRGNTYDVVMLEVDVDVPHGANCARVDFRFFSEEYPDYVGQSVNDAFVIELDQSTWRVLPDATLSAPDNFAFDSEGDPVTINTTGRTAMSRSNALGTAFNGATPLLTAGVPVTPGDHTFIFSIFDVGDAIYDSAAFIDNLRFTTVDFPLTQCRRGARPSVDETAVPLLGAHGITGDADDMEHNLELATELVPTLGGSSTYSTTTAEIGSVWDNGKQVVRDAEKLTRDTGQPRVNVIAHSKGGLDTRVAMWESPHLFRGLGMLATPNGGSIAADKLCAMRRVSGKNWPFPEQGPCDDASNGLFNLQTGYVGNTLNKQVRGWPQHINYVTAGDCTAVTPTDLGSAACTATNIVASNCSFATLLAEVDQGSDGVVCVSSAFDQTDYIAMRPPAFAPDKVHHALLPVHRLDHSAMREDPCPTAQVVASLYGSKSVDNPYRDGVSCQDSGLEMPSGEDNSGVGGQAIASAARSVETLEDTNQAPQIGQTVRQTVAVVPVTGVEPTEYRLNPEQGSAISAEIWSDVPLHIAVIDGVGQDVENVVFGPSTDLGGYQYFVSLEDTAGEERVAVISSDRDANIGVVTYVESGGHELKAEVEPLSPTSARISASLSNSTAALLGGLNAFATVQTSGGPVDAALTLLNEDGSHVLVGEVPTIPGQWNPIDLTLTGDISRSTTVGVIAPDDTASIGEVIDDELVDTDGDGVIDSLAVNISVDVERAGTYQLAVDFTGPGGEIAFSAPGSAELDAGSGPITLLAPINALIAGGIEGPYTVTSGIMTLDDAVRTVVAEKAMMGTVGKYDFSALPVTETNLFGTQLVRNGDELVVSARATLPVAGEYVLTGSLMSPSGAKAAQALSAIELSAGVSTVHLSFDVNEALTEPGRYTITDLSIAPIDEPELVVLGPPAAYDHEVENSSDWKPVLRSEESVALTNQFQAVGPHADVLTGGDFTCDSSVQIDGDVVAVGDVYMTNNCVVIGNVRAGGSVTLDGTPRIEGDLVASGRVVMQSTATILGAITTGGEVTISDGRTLEQLQESGAIGGAITENDLVDIPPLPDSAKVIDAADWSGYSVKSWNQWMNETAAANSAPTWSSGLSSTPGCVMAPWADSVNGTDVVIDTPTVVDARGSGCAGGVALQGMTLTLNADMVLYAGRFSSINGLNVSATNGRKLHLIVAEGAQSCQGGPAVSLSAQTTIDPTVQVQVLTGGRTEMNGLITMTGNVDTRCWTGSGTVNLTAATN